MLTAFDHIAAHYDEEFTYSLIGLAQRKLVWKCLEKLLQENPNAKILELNCGTGEDAIWMATKGATVLATDISTEMVRLAEAKAIANQLQHKITCKRLDLNYFQDEIGDEKFDIIFSNFGGLNCVSPEVLNNLLQHQLPPLLTKNGSMVFVIMPTFCLWESLWHIITFKKKNIFRRLSNKPIEASLGVEKKVMTWYYSPKWIKTHLAVNMKFKKIKPIGFFIPPSYLNHTFSKRKKLFAILERLEHSVSNMAFLSSASDHYLAHLQKHEQ